MQMFSSCKALQSRHTTSNFRKKRGGGGFGHKVSISNCISAIPRDDLGAIPQRLGSRACLLAMLRPLLMKSFVRLSVSQGT